MKENRKREPNNQDNRADKTRVCWPIFTINTSLTHCRWIEVNTNCDVGELKLIQTVINLLRVYLRNNEFDLHNMLHSISDVNLRFTDKAFEIGNFGVSK